MSTDLYLELIETLNMENEFRKLLYSIPRLTVQKIIENVIYSTPSYGFKVVYDPALNVCNSLDDQHRSELISSLLQMIVEYGKIIKADDQLFIELFRSTARHIENHLDSNLSSSQKLDTSQNLENIQNNAEIDYFFSTLYYPDLDSQAKSRQKRVYQPVKLKSKNTTQIDNTSKLFEDLHANLQRAPRDNHKYLYQLLCLFDYLAFIICKDEQQAYQVNSLMKLIMHRVIQRLKKANLTNSLNSLNGIYSNDNESINNLIKYIDAEPQKKLSNLEFRSKRIAHRLQEDKSEYRNATLNLKAAYHMNSKNSEPLNKHEENANRRSNKKRSIQLLSLGDKLYQISTSWIRISFKINAAICGSI
ncbi:hypothetical protein C1645_435703 [Glomus cerebriforme]|uniref:Uncharacterized protein n=1 Tax=Glomus cerebriforme TaxID=658196 RepID=A0A397TDL8_9GLOM|nr:hypothetical protein C1645_435703 [Glomus cerebriforme]